MYKALLQTVSTCRQVVSLAAGVVKLHDSVCDAVVSAAFLFENAGAALHGLFDNFIARTTQRAAKEIALSFIDEFQV